MTEANDFNGTNNHGDNCKGGDGGGLDPAAKSYLENKTKELGALQALTAFKTGCSRLSEQKFEEAVDFFRKAAELGNSDAMVKLADCLRDGDGVDKDLEEAIKWYRKAAKASNSRAMVELAGYYAEGAEDVGVKQSWEEAAELYSRAAEVGNLNAMFFWGECLYNGYGVGKNSEKAVKWWLDAAKAGVPAAMHNLGSCYAAGDGVEQSWEEAVEWYHKAAEAGVPESMELLRRIGKMFNND